MTSLELFDSLTNPVKSQFCRMNEFTFYEELIELSLSNLKISNDEMINDTVWTLPLLSIAIIVVQLIILPLLTSVEKK